MREKDPYSKLFWFVFSHIQTECREILRIPSYSVQMQENVDQSNFEYRHFLRSVTLIEANAPNSPYHQIFEVSFFIFSLVIF